MIARGTLSEDENKRFQDKETNSSLSNKSITNQLLRLPEEEFCRLVAIRLNTPLSKADQKEFGEEPREYWSLNYLVEEIFLKIAQLRILVTHNGKQVSIYKYYNQALRLKSGFP